TVLCEWTRCGYIAFNTNSCTRASVEIGLRTSKKYILIFKADSIVSFRKYDLESNVLISYRRKVSNIIPLNGKCPVEGDTVNPGVHSTVRNCSSGPEVVPKWIKTCTGCCSRQWCVCKSTCCSRQEFHITIIIYQELGVRYPIKGKGKW